MYIKSIKKIYKIKIENNIIKRFLKSEQMENKSKRRHENNSNKYKTK